jgi:UDP-2,3-diacylglucosamine hydrolase
MSTSAHTPVGPGPGLQNIQADTGWGAVDVISDLHLDESEPFNFVAWRRYMETTTADAVIILGDWFDVWIGDDVAQTGHALPMRHEGLNFYERCARVMRFASETRSLFVMHGNRDFLLGPEFLSACNAQLLADPCVLHWGAARYALTHGDALCTDDHDYQRFRTQVRTAQWQSQFLAQSLQARRQAALQMREKSKAAQRERERFIDVNAQSCAQLLLRTHAHHLVHGHTHTGGHYPVQHSTAPDQEPSKPTRFVTTDWQQLGPHPRGDVLRITPQGVARLNIAQFATHAN